MDVLTCVFRFIRRCQTRHNLTGAAQQQQQALPDRPPSAPPTPGSPRSSSPQPDSGNVAVGTGQNNGSASPSGLNLPDRIYGYQEEDRVRISSDDVFVDLPSDRAAVLVLLPDLPGSAVNISQPTDSVSAFVDDVIAISADTEMEPQSTNAKKSAANSTDDAASISISRSSVTSRLSESEVSRVKNATDTNQSKSTSTTLRSNVSTSSREAATSGRQYRQPVDAANVNCSSTPNRKSRSNRNQTSSRPGRARETRSVVGERRGPLTKSVASTTACSPGRSTSRKEDQPPSTRDRTSTPNGKKSSIPTRRTVTRTSTGPNASRLPSDTVILNELNSTENQRRTARSTTRGADRVATPAAGNWKMSSSSPVADAKSRSRSGCRCSPAGRHHSKDGGAGVEVEAGHRSCRCGSRTASSEGTASTTTHGHRSPSATPPPSKPWARTLRDFVDKSPSPVRSRKSTPESSAASRQTKNAEATTSSRHNSPSTGLSGPSRAVVVVADSTALGATRSDSTLETRKDAKQSAIPESVSLDAMEKRKTAAAASTGRCATVGIAAGNAWWKTRLGEKQRATDLPRLQRTKPEVATAARSSSSVSSALSNGDPRKSQKLAAGTEKSAETAADGKLSSDCERIKPPKKFGEKVAAERFKPKEILPRRNRILTIAEKVSTQTSSAVVTHPLSLVKRFEGSETDNNTEVFRNKSAFTSSLIHNGARIHRNNIINIVENHRAGSAFDEKESKMAARRTRPASADISRIKTAKEQASRAASVDIQSADQPCPNNGGHSMRTVPGMARNSAAAPSTRRPRCSPVVSTLPPASVEFSLGDNRRSRQRDRKYRDARGSASTGTSSTSKELPEVAGGIAVVAVNGQPTAGSSPSALEHHCTSPADIDVVFQIGDSVEIATVEVAPEFIVGERSNCLNLPTSDQPETICNSSCVINNGHTLVIRPVDGPAAVSLVNRPAIIEGVYGIHTEFRFMDEVVEGPRSAAIESSRLTGRSTEMSINLDHSLEQTEDHQAVEANSSSVTISSNFPTSVTQHPRKSTVEFRPPLTAGLDQRDPDVVSVTCLRGDYSERSSEKIVGDVVRKRLTYVVSVRPSTSGTLDRNLSELSTTPTAAVDSIDVNLVTPAIFHVSPSIVDDGASSGLVCGGNRGDTDKVSPTSGDEVESYVSNTLTKRSLSSPSETQSDGRSAASTELTSSETGCGVAASASNSSMSPFRFIRRNRSAVMGSSLDRRKLGLRVGIDFRTVERSSSDSAYHSMSLPRNLRQLDGTSSSGNAACSSKIPMVRTRTADRGLVSSSRRWSPDLSCIRRVMSPDDSADDEPTISRRRPAVEDFVPTRSNTTTRPPRLLQRLLSGRETLRSKSYDVDEVANCGGSSSADCSPARPRRPASCCVDERANEGDCDEDDDDDLILVDVRRYRSLSRRGVTADATDFDRCPPTPPLAVFLSSEDISATVFPLRHAASEPAASRDRAPFNASPRPIRAVGNDASTAGGGPSAAAAAAPPTRSHHADKKPRPKSECIGMRLASKVVSTLALSSERRRLLTNVVQRSRSSPGNRTKSSSQAAAAAASGVSCYSFLYRSMSQPHLIKSRDVRQMRSHGNRRRGNRTGEVDMVYHGNCPRPFTSLPDVLYPDGSKRKRRERHLIQVFTPDDLSQSTSLSLPRDSSQFGSDDELDERTHSGADLTLVSPAKSSDLSGCSNTAQRQSSAAAFASNNNNNNIKADGCCRSTGALLAQAVWDHVTVEPDELGFGAGDVIEVEDTSDRDWWWGRTPADQGWFPATFVILKSTNRDDGDSETHDNNKPTRRRTNIVDDDAVTSPCASVTSADSMVQSRRCVVREIIKAESDYVKHLHDVIEGYMEKTRTKPDMFSAETISTIFGNIEEIYEFSKNFLCDLQKQLDVHQPELSEIGGCFVHHKRGFEIYSDYCNNHSLAGEVLCRLQRDAMYQCFFEMCRLQQRMIAIPLEGFLLTPIQKICKYPLQLRELLCYTWPSHPDYRQLQAAHDAMRDIAALVNERKRKMESLEKLAAWQQTVLQWQGASLIETSSELIHSGDLTKISVHGWHQDRVFYLFDHQMIYLKKDLLWRNMLVYRGRINMDNSIVHEVPDGRDAMFGVSVKNAFRLYDRVQDKWYLLVCSSPADRTQWMDSFEAERQRVTQDRLNGFTIDAMKRPVFSNKTLKRGANRLGRQKSKRNRKRVLVFDDQMTSNPLQT